MSVGAELLAAREQLGLSREDVSQRTKISVERLQAIEQEDLPNLPPLVYLKGFVREYATAVKLDPDQITNRYLQELDEPAGLISREPEDLTADEPAIPDFSAAAAGDEGGPGVRAVMLTSSSGTALFDSEDDVVAEPPESTTPVPAARSIARVPSVSSKAPLLFRVADPVPPLETDEPAPDFAGMLPASRAPFRGSRVALGVAIAVLAGILISANSGFLGRFGSRKATDTSEARSSARPAVQPDAAPAARVNAGPPVESPARANNDRSNEPPAVRSPQPAPPPPTPVVQPPRPATLPPPKVAETNVVPPLTPRREVAPAAAVAPSTAPAPPPAAVEEAPLASPSALTGNWSLTTRIEATDVDAFENMNLGFRLQLRQDGERVTGRGLKWMENGKLIPTRSRTPIVVEGIRRGNRLELRFTEHGTERTSTGTFVMDVDDDGTLRGQFASTSANSSGSTIARRITPEGK